MSNSEFNDFLLNDLVNSDINKHTQEIRELQEQNRAENILNKILPLIKNSGKDVRDAFGVVIEDITKDKFWKAIVTITSLIVSVLVSAIVSYLVSNRM
jgi:deoxyhypusine synthase